MDIGFFLHGLWTQQGSGLQWTLYDGLRQGQALPWMFQVTRKLTDLLKVEHLGLFVAQGFRQLHSNTCGAIALLHLAQHLQLLEGTSHTEIAELHAWLLSLDFGISYIYGGGPDESQRQLAALLATKGVPTSAADERARMIFNKMGYKKMQNILKAKNVWAELKSAASQPGIMFSLVTMEERKHYIAERAKTKHGAQISNHRAKKALKNKAHEAPLHLDPNQFDLEANHFKDENDLPVPQLAYTDVETEARGVALCTLDMAHHFLEQTSSISTDALALLFVDVHDADLIANSGLKPIVIPAKFKGTGETTLIYGHILPIGDLQVSRESASQDSSPDVIDTKVIKFQVFRDQFTVDWNRFADATVRTLIAAMDSLQLCKGAQCGAACNKFHPGLDETIDNMIFELWARSFFDDNGRKTTSDHASLFTAFMRVPEGALHKIMLGTPQGVYVEPRGSQPREHDAHYKVVWLPGATAETAAHQCRTFDKAICLVRMKTKYGIRVRKEGEKAAWENLRPGIDFVDMCIQLIYELFPIPHGTQRLYSVIGAGQRDHFSQERAPEHMAWRVGAQNPPPRMVMTGIQNDIVITQVKEIKNTQPQKQLVASSKTHKHLRAQPASTMASKSSQDPWTDAAKDPWANYGRSTLPSLQGDGKTRPDALQSKLREDLGSKLAVDLEQHAQAAVKAATASSSSANGQHEHRLKALEVGLQELQGQNAQFTTWFPTGGRQTAKYRGHNGCHAADLEHPST